MELIPAIEGRQTILYSCSSLLGLGTSRPTCPRGGCRASGQPDGAPGRACTTEKSTDPRNRRAARWSSRARTSSPTPEAGDGGQCSARIRRSFLTASDQAAPVAGRGDGPGDHGLAQQEWVVARQKDDFFPISVPLGSNRSSTSSQRGSSECLGKRDDHVRRAARRNMSPAPTSVEDSGAPSSAALQAPAHW